MASRLITRAASSKLLLQLRNRMTSRIPRRAYSTDPAQYFHYTRAIFGSVTKSLVDNALRAKEPETPINLQKALRDHENYVRQVKMLVPNTVQIPPQEEFPDMVFVEDPTVVNGKKALITKMGPRSRAGEAKLMRSVLEEMGLEIMEIDDPEALIEGGDVMFTGREFLVGVSKRTNKVRPPITTTPHALAYKMLYILYIYVRLS